MNHLASHEHVSNNREVPIAPHVSVRFPDGPPLTQRGPGIVVMAGLPGSGKTTAANWLAGQARLNGRATAVLDVDEVRLDILGSMHERRDAKSPQGPLYQFAPEVIARTYEELDTRMVQALQQGKLVLYVGNPQSQQQRSKALVAADNGLQDVPCVTVWTNTDPDLALQRVANTADATRPFAGSVTAAILQRDHASQDLPSDNTTEPYARLTDGWNADDVAALYPALCNREEC